MKYFAPAVRALCERVRRPASIQIVLGAALIAPAALIGKNEKTQIELMGMQTLPALVVDVTPAALNGIQRFGPEPPIPAGLRLAGRAVETVKVEAGIGAKATAVTDAGETGSATAYAARFKISEPLAKQIHKAAVANGIAPQTAFGLVRAESGFRSRAISPVGAVGLTQIMPATARWLKPGTSRSDLMDPSFNLHMGFRYLRQLIDDYEGNERLALTAFNRGPGTVNKLLRRGRNPDNGYADKVLTGRSSRHVALMNAKFGRKRSS
ncbi:MAG: lytic transglycosylase domain-containing protein [Longimicrobiales bacterium]